MFLVRSLLPCDKDINVLISTTVMELTGINMAAIRGVSCPEHAKDNPMTL
jgi:hypothetical protein